MLCCGELTELCFDEAAVWDCVLNADVDVSSLNLGRCVRGRLDTGTVTEVGGVAAFGACD